MLVVRVHTAQYTKSLPGACGQPDLAELANRSAIVHAVNAVNAVHTANTAPRLHSNARQRRPPERLRRASESENEIQREPARARTRPSENEIQRDPAYIYARCAGRQAQSKIRSVLCDLERKEPASIRVHSLL